MLEFKKVDHIGIWGRRQIRFTWQRAGGVVGRQDPCTPVELDDTRPYIVVQLDHQRDQRLPHPNELPQMGQETHDGLDLHRQPDVSAHRIGALGKSQSDEDSRIGTACAR